MAKLSRQLQPRVHCVAKKKTYIEYLGVYIEKNL